MSKILRYFIFLCFVRPVILVVLGLNVRGREKLPKAGPAILVANHNSHLDTMVLMSLFPMNMLERIRPVAAADYFLSGRFISWFSQEIIGIIPISRVRNSGEDPLAGISRALDTGSIVIFFPEGTRGEPEQMTRFKSWIAKLSERHPSVPIVPIFLHGLGKALPKGEGILVPFFTDVFIGDPMRWSGSKDEFLSNLEGRVQTLAAEAPLPQWE